MTGQERFLEIFNKYKNRKILLYGDPDVDGLISLYLMCEFCSMMNLEYTYYVNDHRFHGFTLNPKNLSNYMVIAADFTITESVMQNLVDNDVVVLSTDHHHCQQDFIDIKGKNAEGIVINNQYPFEPEEDRYLSGAGVFFELICALWPEFNTKLRRALVGITLLSDVRPTESDKAKKYLDSTYHIDPETPYIKYIINSTMTVDYTFGIPRLDRNFIDFTFSPTVNSLLRFNKTQEAIDFILGNGLKNGNGSRQAQSNLMSIMLNKMMVKEFPHISIIAIQDTDFADMKDVDITDFIGVLCSNYKDTHGDKCTLGMAIVNNKVKRASFRGRYDDVHYLNGVKSLGVKADGHPAAFGLIDLEPTQALWCQLDDLVNSMEMTHERTITIKPVSNLLTEMAVSGLSIATHNCYVRDCYRTYYKYTGHNIQEIKHTYKMEEFTTDDYLKGVKPDKIEKGISYKYVFDSEGKPITKYIEYLVDERKVKSFGVPIEEGLILPILDKNYIQLYVKPMID